MSVSGESSSTEKSAIGLATNGGSLTDVTTMVVEAIAV